MPPRSFSFSIEIDLVPLVRYREGRRHAGYASADHERRFVDGEIELLQGLQMAGPGHGHADDVLGLVRGVLLLLLVDPGVMLPDVGHLVVVLVDARLPQGVAEKGLERPGGAGGDDDAVEPFLLGDCRVICFAEFRRA